VPPPESQFTEEEDLVELLTFDDGLIDFWHVTDKKRGPAKALAAPAWGSLRLRQCASPFSPEPREPESHLADFDMFKDLAFD
jgi:hypothetical protein